jgi:hypothetical protein
MSSVEASVQDGFSRRHTSVSALVVTPFDLGPGNSGTIGSTPRIDADELRAAMSDPQFMTEWNGVFDCVDGRTSTGGDKLSSLGARARIVGGMAFASTMGDIMNPNMPDHIVDEAHLLASNASQIASAGIADHVHGHDQGHRHNLAGCAGNFKKREALSLMGRNVNVIAPRVWAVAEASGLLVLSDGAITPEDATKVIVTGATRAQHSSSFIDPAHTVEIATKYGAAYEEKTGPHLEIDTAATVGEEVFDTRLFARAYGGTEQDIVQLFGASFGIFAREAYKLARDRGYSPHTAALKVLGGIAFTIGTLKIIGSPQLRSSIVTR